MIRIQSLILSFIFLFFFHFAAASEQLIVEPDASRYPILSMINGAKSTIQVIMYGFTDEQFIQALTQARKSGKNVQVLLEPQPYKSENENTFALSHLRMANINLLTPNPDVKLTHQKTILIDHNHAIVMTFNLTHSSFKNERNFALIIDDPGMIQEINQVLIADSQHRNIAVSQPNLIWSPQNSREKMLNFITYAQSNIKIYAQDISDYQLIGTLAKAARSGKQVSILMSQPPDARKKKLEYLRKAGVEIHFSHHYLIHAKVIIVDNKRAILGSINFTRPSLNDNRELAVITDNPKVIKELLNTFAQDWSETPFEQKKIHKKIPEFSRVFLKELIRVSRQLS